MMMNHFVFRVKTGAYETFSPSADSLTPSGGCALSGSGSSVRSSVSTGTPNRRPSSTRLSIVGMVWSASHLLTACRDNPSCPPSAS